MPRYIDAVNFSSRLRAVAEKSLQKDYNQFLMEEAKSETAGLLRAIEILNSQHTADVQEVRHGRWIRVIGENYECSNCKAALWARKVYPVSKYKYCWNCGAKMDGGERDAEQQAETDNDSKTG